MDLIVVNYQQPENDEQRLQHLWKFMCMIRGWGESPVIWKLTQELLGAIGQFYRIQEQEKLLSLSFLDTPMDRTSKEPHLVCEARIYPVFCSMNGAGLEQVPESQKRN